MFMPDLLEQGIILFNSGKFYEAHEVWEAVWMQTQGPGKEFYQGLIQLAVACHHLSQRNLSGAQKVFATAQQHLQPSLSLQSPFDVNALIHRIGQCIERESIADLPPISLPAA